MNAIQLTVFDFVDTPDFSEFCLLKGTGIENGKKRILDYVSKNENMEDFPKFVSKEYGWGGQSCSTYSIDYSPNGWECNNKKTGENIKLSWKKVAVKILGLIANGKYEEDEQ